MKLSKKTDEKLKNKHTITKVEAEQAFQNPLGNVYIDDRPEHRSNPPKQWFIGETMTGKKVKVVFIETDAETILVSAYEPKEKTKQCYKILNQKDGLEIDI